MNGSVRVVVVGNDWVIGRGVQRTLESAGYTVSDVVVCTDEALAAAARDGSAAVYADGAPDGASRPPASGHGGQTPGEVARDAGAPAGHPAAAGVSPARPAGYVITPIRDGRLLSAVATGASQARLPAASAARPEMSGTFADSRPDTGSATGARPRNLDDGRPGVPDVASAIDRHARAQGSASALTPREQEIVRLLLSNGRVRSIADQLEISPHTVRNHLRSVFRKLGVHSQVELIRTLTAHMPD